MELSFIIVNYNVTAFLEKCLASIQKYAQNLDYEVIVIDNNSPDTSWKELISQFPDVQFIANSQNVGFAKANNIAINKATGNYLYLLNPDTELEASYLSEILKFADSQPKLGALGLRMHDAKGNFLPESKRAVPTVANSFEKLYTNFRRNPAKSYYRTDIQEHEIAQVDILTGANLLIRREVYKDVGGLDESYFMYGEDIDLCYTLKIKGFKNFYYGKHSILHHKGESTVKDATYLRNFYGAMQIFINKYHYKNRFQHLILTCGLHLRYFLEKMR